MSLRWWIIPHTIPLVKNHLQSRQQQWWTWSWYFSTTFVSVSIAVRNSITYSTLPIQQTLSWVDRFLNWKACWFKLSVLSTKSSILSPRSKTRSIERRIFSKGFQGMLYTNDSALTNIMNHDILHLLNFSMHLLQFVRSWICRVLLLFTVSYDVLPPYGSILHTYHLLGNNLWEFIHSINRSI